MRFYQFSGSQRRFIVKVRIIDRSNSMTVNFVVESDCISQTRLIASKLFGASNVLSITQCRGEFVESTETLKADQLQIKSLQDQQKRYGELAKREKARQSLEKAQKKMLNAFALATN